jgi:hypothetical protein
MPEPNPHLYVATPMFGGQNCGFYENSMLMLQNTCIQKGVQLSVSGLFNESLVTRARNALVYGFLLSDASHLMFIDADIKFDPDHLLPMISADKDIICGIYPKKEINWGAVRAAIAAGVPDDQLRFHTGSLVFSLIGGPGTHRLPMNEPVEIMHGATGFMLIKRAVFELLAPHVDWYYNDTHYFGTGVMGEKILEFFTTSIDQETHKLLSEDYHFCKLARSKGLTIYAAPWVQLGHFGPYLFEGCPPRADRPLVMNGA